MYYCFMLQTISNNFIFVLFNAISNNFIFVLFSARCFAFCTHRHRNRGEQGVPMCR